MGAQLLAMELVGARLGRAAAEVHEPRVRLVEDLPAELVQAVGEVDLVVVHEEVGVEPACLFERLSAHQDRRPDDPVDLLAPGKVDACPVEGVQGLRPGREPAKEEVLRRQAPHGRKSSNRPLPPSVLGRQPWPDDRDPRRCVHRLHEAFDALVERPCVRIENEDVSTGGGVDAHVVPGSVAKIALELDDANRRESSSYEAYAPVVGGVVHHDDLVPAPLDAPKAPLEMALAVVRYDNDGDGWHGRDRNRVVRGCIRPGRTCQAASAMRSAMSILELLHPDGAPAGARVFGTECPPRLAPSTEAAHDVDLVVLAPGRPERHAAWSPEAMTVAATSVLRPGGVVAAIGGLRTRRVLARRLERHGLVARLTLAHVAVGEATALVSTGVGAARFVRDGVGGRRARVLSAPFAGPAVAARGLATLVLAAPETPVAGWLRARGQPAFDGLVLRPSWRGPDGTATVTGVAGGRPVAVGKLGLGTEQTGLAELVALRYLGASARAAGALVPGILGLATLGDRIACLLEPVPGRVVAARVRGRTDARVTAERVAGWLARWSSATTIRAPASPAVAAEVDAPLAALEAELDPAYVDRVRRLAGAARAGEQLRCARHGDLTLWNVTLAGNALGIIDWEGAAPTALPLTDLPYLVVDAVAAEGGYGDRVDAYRACFAREGSRREWAGQLVRQTAATAGVGVDGLELSAHACWLGHAADERRRGVVDGPFLRILRMHTQTQVAR